MKTAGKNKKSPQPTGNWLRGNWKHSENSRKKLKFSLKNCKIGRQGREDSPQSARQKSPTALKRLDISIKCASKMARRFCCFCTIQQRKKPMTSFLSWAYGGKKGIRTLEGFRGPTRFPVVRLRPAQPSFHFLCCIVDFSIHDQFCDNRGNTISCFRVPHDCLDIIPAIPEKVKSFF